METQEVSEGFGVKGWICVEEEKVAEALVMKGLADVVMFLCRIYEMIEPFRPGEGGWGWKCDDGMDTFGLVVVMEIQVVMDNVGDTGVRLGYYVGEMGLCKCAKIGGAQGIRKIGKYNKK